MTSAARKSSAAEYLIPTHARAGFFTREFLARKTRCGSVESSNPQTKQWQPLRALPDGKGWPLMFANDGDEPGAGRAGAHRSVRKNGDGGSNTPNQPLAQINPSPAQTNAAIAARAILNKALELGIHVGVSPDGCELILVAPLKVPRDVRRWFEIWLDNFRDEAIAIILGDNGMLS